MISTMCYIRITSFILGASQDVLNNLPSRATARKLIHETVAEILTLA